MRGRGTPRLAGLLVVVIGGVCSLPSAADTSDTGRDTNREPLPLVSDPLGDDNRPASPRGPRYVLEKIVIEGNRKTLRQVVLRYVNLKPGEAFASNDPRLEEARYRMLASGLFYDVQLSLEKGARRGWVVLLVSVKERNTIIVQDVVLGTAEIAKFFGSLDVAERSFLGTGVTLSAAGVYGTDGQWGYRLRLLDDHFLDSDFSLHVEGLYANARDFFGRKNVCVESANEADANLYECSGYPNEEGQYIKSVDYAVMSYSRAGIRLGTGYTVLRDIYFYFDYRYETISADVPKAGYHKSFGAYRPIQFGHLLLGHSMLSSMVFGIRRDSRDSITLPSTGSRIAFDVEVSSEIFGSDYDFAKFTLSYDKYFGLGRGHTLKLGLFGGLIMGDSPFFNQFFVGDFSSFVPPRVLELNFSHLQPNLLGNTMIKEMRYEDIVGSINVEYSLPFYRGHGLVYGVNGFVSLGLYFLTSPEHLKVDPQGYSGIELIPMDLTVDLGVRVDTKVGVFEVSLANVLLLIPGQRATEE